jgi:hypothetical protein
VLKGHESVGGGKQCVIAPKANVPAGLDACASLPHDDVTSTHLFAAILLDA